MSDDLKIIGLSGYAQSGKDTVGKMLVEQGYERLAFADTLKIMLLELNPIALVVKSGGSVVRWRVQDVVQANGWEQAKKIGDVRELLQRLGMSGRRLIGDDVWVKAVFDLVDDLSRFVITDVRFPDEAQAIKDAGGQVWRIERPDTEPVNRHESETALDDWAFDLTIVNGGTLEELQKQALVTLEVAADLTGQAGTMQDGSQAHQAASAG